MDPNLIDILQSAYIGEYIFNLYQINSYENLIIPSHMDVDVFYYILGWHIRQSYPEAYICLLKSIKTE